MKRLREKYDIYDQDGKGRESIRGIKEFCFSETKR